MGNSNARAAGGVDIGTAQMIASKGVEVVLTGNCSPNAYQTLSAAGIRVISGVAGRIREAVGAYKAGKLQGSTRPSMGRHCGMGMGVGLGIMPQAFPGGGNSRETGCSLWCGNQSPWRRKRGS